MPTNNRVGLRPTPTDHIERKLPGCRVFQTMLVGSNPIISRNSLAVVPVSGGPGVDVKGFHAHEPGQLFDPEVIEWASGAVTLNEPVNGLASVFKRMVSQFEEGTGNVSSIPMPYGFIKIKDGDAPIVEEHVSGTEISVGEAKVWGIFR